MTTRECVTCLMYKSSTTDTWRCSKDPPPSFFKNRNTLFMLNNLVLSQKQSIPTSASLLRPFALSRRKIKKKQNCSFICLRFCIFPLYMYAVDDCVCWAFCLFIGKMAATFQSKEEWKKIQSLFSDCTFTLLYVFPHGGNVKPKPAALFQQLFWHTVQYWLLSNFYTGFWNLLQRMEASFIALNEYFAKRNFIVIFQKMEHCI